MRKLILLNTIFFCCATLSYAQRPGALDSSFGNNGIVIDNLDKSAINSSEGKQALLQADGSFYLLLETKG